MIRPSNLGRIERCPGSVALEETVTTPENSSEIESRAQRGTRLHAAVSESILNPSKRQEIVFSSCQDDEEIQAVERCIKEAETVWNDVLTPSQRARAQVKVEKLIPLESIGIDQGTADLLIICPPTDAEDGLIVVRDWKMGVGWVPSARWNLQIMAYAIGSVEHIENYSADLGIVQPAVREYTDRWIASKDDLLRVQARIAHVIAEADKPEPVLQCGAWCGYCKAKMICNARAVVASEVKSLIDPVTVIKNLEGKPRSELYNKLGEAIKILEAAKEKIDAEILTGSFTIDGYEIGPGKSGRFWSKEKSEMVEQLTEIATERGFTKYDVLEPITPTKADKLFGKNGGHVGYIAIKEGNPTIKRVKIK